jgi:hypothetical protein
METELWPNLLHGCAASGLSGNAGECAPVGALRRRLCAPSGLTRAMLAAIDWIAAQGRTMRSASARWYADAGADG